MPGQIDTPTPTLVMPHNLCVSFVESREYTQLRNDYHDGTPQAAQLSQTSRRTFKQARKLTSSQLATLSTFYRNLDGPLAPFLFYNPQEGSPVGTNYDPTGVNPVGRYVCVFRNSWNQVTNMQRSETPDLELVELAPMSDAYLDASGFGPHGAITQVEIV